MRALHEFHGGVFPPEHKRESSEAPIRTAGLPPELILPLSQHIGAPSRPMVEVGDTVLKGQRIAEAQGVVSAPLHAPTSGTVAAIEDRPIAHPSGMSARCLVLEPDGADRWIEHGGVEDYQHLERSELLERLRDAGVVGLGGAGFPTAVKLATGTGHPIDTLIINATECEPYITADDRLLRERADEVIAGARILRHLVEPTEATVIGIEDNKPEAIAAVRAAAEHSGIEIAVFPAKYPSGGEKQLIQILTGREVPAGGLPADIGVVCQNVGTCAAAWRAVVRGEPLISRITTLTGAACRDPGNFEVLLGTPVGWLLQRAACDREAADRLIMGGPMMGFTLPDDRVGVIKTTNCLLAPTVGEIGDDTLPQACIRCGMCSEVCPAQLLPQQLYWFSRGHEYDKLESHQLMDCIECGACSYVCPSNIPLVQYYRASKGTLRQKREEKLQAERAKQRFEAHKVRIARQEAEKEARRQARKERASKKAAAGGDADPIQAAVERSKARREAQQTADPGTAAIERALAKRRGDDSPAEPADQQEQAIARLRQRLDKAEARLESGRGSDNEAALENAVVKLREKLAAAQAEAAQRRSTEQSVPVAPAQDPATQAIERARTRRAESAALSEEQKLARTVTSLEGRLEKARQRLASAEAEGSEHRELLAETVTKLEHSLARAREQMEHAE